ncbi:MAG TPA: polysaccharide deacetylase family protein [Kofleriaceae bacterium]|nr:polysaccharide deacetylase family protein [Kofleriaceae bacterium]
MIAALAAVTGGCQVSVDELDGVFYDGDGRTVHCGVNLDTSANTSIASVDAALDRARDRREVVELYAHHPGDTVPLEKLDYVLRGARDRGLASFTYADFAHGRPIEPGLALSFDDTSVEAWFAMRPMLQQYGALVTFFVSRYYNLGDEAHGLLKQLAAEGHAVEAHSVLHLRAPDYVEERGLNAYVHDEVDPSIAILRDDGFTVEAFAYPFGARTDELDRAIAKRVPVIRSVAFTYQFVGDPCPR